jgi:hypothetical protein
VSKPRKAKHILAIFVDAAACAVVCRVFTADAKDCAISSLLKVAKTCRNPSSKILELCDRSFNNSPFQPERARLGPSCGQ